MLEWEWNFFYSISEKLQNYFMPRTELSVGRYCKVCKHTENEQYLLSKRMLLSSMSGKVFAVPIRMTSSFCSQSHCEICDISAHPLHWLTVTYLSGCTFLPKMPDSFVCKEKQLLIWRITQRIYFLNILRRSF